MLQLLWPAHCWGSVVRLPEEIGQTVMQALALAVLIIGISMGLQSSNILIPIASLAVGSIIGKNWIWNAGSNAWERPYSG